MTPLGKMLVFLVLLLTLVWNALVVNAYVTRTNWKALADQYKKKAEEYAEADDTDKKRLRDALDAAEAEARVAREERDRYRERLDTAQTQIVALNKNVSEKIDALAKLGIGNTGLQANLKSVQDQVDLQDKQLAEKDQKVNALVLSEQAAKAAQTKAEIEAAGYKVASERVTERAQTLAEQIQLMKRGGGSARPVAPEGFRGAVKSVTGTGGDTLVEFSPGANAQLKKDTQLTIVRLNGSGRLIGTLIVVSVDPFDAVGRFTPAPGGGPPQVNDEVRP